VKSNWYLDVTNRSRDRRLIGNEAIDRLFQASFLGGRKATNFMQIAQFFSRIVPVAQASQYFAPKMGQCNTFSFSCWFPKSDVGSCFATRVSSYLNMKTLRSSRITHQHNSLCQLSGGGSGVMCNTARAASWPVHQRLGMNY
jgi:hypothetical protein